MTFYDGSLKSFFQCDWPIKWNNYWVNWICIFEWDIVSCERRSKLFFKVTVCLFFFLMITCQHVIIGYTCFTCFQCNMHRRHLLTCYVNGRKMCLTVKQGVFWLIVEQMTIIDLKEEDYELFIFLDIWDNSNDFSVVECYKKWLQVELGCYCSLNVRRMWTFQSFYLSQNDFLILLALVWCQINLTFICNGQIQPEISLSAVIKFLTYARLLSMLRDGMSKDVASACNTESRDLDAELC